MALRADSYGTTGEVRAFTRYMLDGEVGFTAATTPPLADVEKFMDRASGVLNAALTRRGLTVPITNTTAKLVCTDWVVAQTVAFVELTQRGAGHSGDENARHNSFINLHKQANEFAKDNAMGFKWLGVGVSHQASEGLVFTGETAVADRADPTDTGLEQSLFRRNQFDSGSSRLDDDVEEST